MEERFETENKLDSMAVPSLYLLLYFRNWSMVCLRRNRKDETGQCKELASPIAPNPAPSPARAQNRPVAKLIFAWLQIKNRNRNKFSFDKAQPNGTGARLGQGITILQQDLCTLPFYCYYNSEAAPLNSLKRIWCLDKTYIP